MSIISEEDIYLDILVDSQRELFQTIAVEAVTKGYATNRDIVVEGFVARESIGSTGMVDDIAIPHVQNETIKEAKVMILKLLKPFEWESLDDQPILFVVALLIPKDDAANSHLSLLSQIAKLLMKAEVKEELQSATTSRAIYQCFAQRL